MFIAETPINNRKSNNRQILSIQGDLSGHVNCCYELGINKLTGDLFYRDVNDEWQPVPLGSGGDSLRFGFAGEDDTAGENRAFDLDGNTFELSGGDVGFGHAPTTFFNVFGNSADLISIDTINFQSLFNATDETAFSYLVLNSNLGGSNVQFALSSSDNTNLVQITGDAIAQTINLGADLGVSINSAYTLPLTDGTAGQVMTTDGSGVATWEDGGGGTVLDDTIDWSVLDIRNAPSGSEVSGDIILVGTSPTGVFSGHANEIATYDGVIWTFDIPLVGDLLYNVANDNVYKWTGSAWILVGKLALHQGGDTYAAPIVMGSIDNFPVTFRQNNGLAGSIGTTANYNLSLGILSHPATSTGNRNTAIGSAALGLNTTGFFNTGLGYGTNYHNTTENYNTAVGWGAIGWNIGVGNTAVGYSALNSTVSVVRGATYNTAIGYEALQNNGDHVYNIGLGVQGGLNATQDATLYVSPFTTDMKFALNSAVGTAPNVIGMDVNGFWHVYGSPGILVPVPEVVSLATAAALPASTYNNGAGGVGATITGNSNGALAAIDGVTAVNGTHLLIKDQAAQLQNGVYIVTQIGDGSNPFILTRLASSDQTAELYPQAVTVVNGNTNAGFLFIQQTASPTIGTNPIVYGFSINVMSTPTWQETLIAGSTLSQDNIVDLNGKFLFFNNNGDNLLSIDPRAGQETARLRMFNNLGPGLANIELHANTGDGENILIQAIDSTGTKTPNIFVDGENNAITYIADTHTFNGLLTLSNYGSGTVTGTPTYSLHVDATGHVIETVLDWQRTLIAGSTLTQDNIVDGGGFELDLLNNIHFDVATTNPDTSNTDFQMDSNVADAPFIILTSTNSAGSLSSALTIDKVFPTISKNGGTNRFITTSVNGNFADLNGNIIIGGSANTIYTADDSIITPRTVDLNSNSLSISQGGLQFLYLNPAVNNEDAYIAAENTTGGGNEAILRGNTSDLQAVVRIAATFDGADKSGEINFVTNATNSSIDSTADIQTFVASTLFTISDLTSELFRINPVNFTSFLAATDGTAVSIIGEAANLVGNDVGVSLGSTDGTNSIGILGNAITNTFNYLAGTHIFTGNEVDFTLTGQFSSVATNGSNVAGFFSGATGSSWTNQLTGSDSVTGFGIQNSQSGNEINRSDASTNIPQTILKIFKEISTIDPPEAGIGGSIDYITKAIAANPSDARQISNQLISAFSDVDFDGGTLTSEFIITGVSNASTTIILTISGAGIFTLVQGLNEYADDVAAAAGSPVIPVNGLYRTGSIVKIRVS